MNDLVILVDDIPGELRRVCHTLGVVGVNIEGLAAFTGEGRSIIHVLVQDTRRALLALAAAQVDTRASRQAVVANLPDRPDALAALLQPLAEAGVNISLAYIAVGERAQSRVVLVTDNPAEARRLLATDPGPANPI